MQALLLQSLVLQVVVLTPDLRELMRKRVTVLADLVKLGIQLGPQG